MRIAIGIPSAGTVSIPFLISLSNTRIHLVNMQLRHQIEGHILLTVESANWISNREQLVNQALLSEATHLLFVDDDMMWGTQSVESLIKRKKDIVVTNYMVKARPATKFVAIGLDNQPIVMSEDRVGVEKIAGSGFGLSLFNLDVFRAVPFPRFQPNPDPIELAYSTEDYPFYEKARNAGFDVWLDNDASKSIMHLGRDYWHWSQYQPPSGA